MRGNVLKRILSMRKKRSNHSKSTVVCSICGKACKSKDGSVQHTAVKHNGTANPTNPRPVHITNSEAPIITNSEAPIITNSEAPIITNSEAPKITVIGAKSKHTFYIGSIVSNVSSRVNKKRKSRSKSAHNRQKKKSKKERETQLMSIFELRKALKKNGKYTCVVDFANITRRNKGMYNPMVAKAIYEFVLKYSEVANFFMFIQKGTQHEECPWIQKLEELGVVDWVAEKSLLDDNKMLTLARDANGFVICAANGGNKYEEPAKQIQGLSTDWFNVHRLEASFALQTIVLDFDLMM